jgi:hypothetical protein
MEPLQEERLAEKILKLILEKEEELWFSTDMAALIRSWNEQSRYKMGAKACEYRDCWERTCGGRKMMETGMWTYWKDPVESPKKVRAEKRMQEQQMNTEEKEAFRKLLDEDILQEIVHRISFQQAGYVSPAHVVAKKPGKDGKKKWRLVVNNIRVNAEQITVHFRMEGAHTVQQVALPGDWATSIDLKSALNHLRVHKEMIPFLCFAFEGQCYAHGAMPFGAKHSPRLFTEALGFAIKYVRQHWSVRVVVYMDDILLLHQDPGYLRLATIQVGVYLQCLG